MLEQVPDCEVLVVPIGGGGLIAGIALAAKTLNPAVQVGGCLASEPSTRASALRTRRPEEAVNSVSSHL